MNEAEGIGRLKELRDRFAVINSKRRNKDGPNPDSLLMKEEKRPRGGHSAIVGVSLERVPNVGQALHRAATAYLVDRGIVPLDTKLTASAAVDRLVDNDETRKFSKGSNRAHAEALAYVLSEYAWAAGQSDRDAIFDAFAKKAGIKRRNNTNLIAILCRCHIHYGDVAEEGRRIEKESSADAQRVANLIRLGVKPEHAVKRIMTDGFRAIERVHSASWGTSQEKSKGLTPAQATLKPGVGGRKSSWRAAELPLRRGKAGDRIFIAVHISCHKPLQFSVEDVVNAGKVGAAHAWEPWDALRQAAEQDGSEGSGLSRPEDDELE